MSPSEAMVAEPPKQEAPHAHGGMDGMGGMDFQVRPFASRRQDPASRDAVHFREKSPFVLSLSKDER